MARLSSNGPSWLCDCMEGASDGGRHCQASECRGIRHRFHGHEILRPSKGPRGSRFRPAGPTDSHRRLLQCYSGTLGAGDSGGREHRGAGPCTHFSSATVPRAQTDSNPTHGPNPGAQKCLVDASVGLSRRGTRLDPIQLCGERQSPSRSDRLSTRLQSKGYTPRR